MTCATAGAAEKVRAGAGRAGAVRISCGAAYAVYGENAGAAAVYVSPGFDTRISAFLTLEKGVSIVLE